MINLVETPEPLALDHTGPDLVIAHTASVDSGFEARTHPSPGQQLCFLGSARPGRPLAVIIPLDALAHDRLSAIERFLSAQRGYDVGDKRLTATQRRRLGHMLRASDGRAEGASLFRIAQSLFGSRLVARAEWQDSSFRYMTLRLVRDSEDLVRGDYRDLLKFRRRPF